MAASFGLEASAAIARSLAMRSLIFARSSILGLSKWLGDDVELEVDAGLNRALSDEHREEATVRVHGDEIRLVALEFEVTEVLGDRLDRVVAGGVSADWREFEESVGDGGGHLFLSG